ncbi:MAG: M48 family metallopeptidase, partial [Planctomycetales bacterium]|nr:M48 family metallopeptidase [Planctomycetales bacterium]
MPAAKTFSKSWSARITATLCGGALVVLFAAYFGLLIWAIFAIFQQLDRLFTGQLPLTATIFLTVVLLLLSVRVAWRLAVSILGLVTQRLDDERWLDERSAKITAEPQLTAVIDRVCERVGSRRPDELRISSDQQCYVIEQRQFAVRTQRRVVLVMGMPQMLAMSVAEVQVILAHELAHFRSGDT